MPRVLNKCVHGEPEGSVYIGRPSKWGNPFVVGKDHNGERITRERAVAQHREWLLYSSEGLQLLDQIKELRGKDLVCWCAPQQCHGDVLLELANEEDA